MTMSRRERALKAVQTVKAKKRREAALMQQKSEGDLNGAENETEPETKELTSTDDAVVSPVEPVNASSHVDDAAVLDEDSYKENVTVQDKQDSPLASTETPDQSEVEEASPSVKELADKASNLDAEEENKDAVEQSENELGGESNLVNDEEVGGEVEDQDFTSEFEEWTESVKDEFASATQEAVHSSPDPTEPVVGANGYQINTSQANITGVTQEPTENIEDRSLPVDKEMATIVNVAEKGQETPTPVERNYVDESSSRQEKPRRDSKGKLEQERKDSKQKKSKYKHVRTDRRVKKTRSRSSRNSREDDDSASHYSQGDAFFNMNKADASTHMLDTVFDLFAIGDDLRSLDEETAFSERSDDSEKSAPFFSALMDAVKSKNGMLKDMEEMFMERLGCGSQEGHAFDVSTVYEDRSMNTAELEGQSSFDTRDISSRPSYDGTENSARWKNKKSDTRSREKNRVYSHQRRHSNISLQSAQSSAKDTRSASSTVQSSLKDGETTTVTSKRTEQSGTTLDVGIYKTGSDDTQSVRMEPENEEIEDVSNEPEYTEKIGNLDKINTDIYAESQSIEPSGSFFSVEEKKEEPMEDTTLASLDDAFAKLDVAAAQRGSKVRLSQAGSNEVALDTLEKTGDLDETELLAGDEDVVTNDALNDSVEQSLNELSVHIAKEETEGAITLEGKQNGVLANKVNGTTGAISSSTETKLVSSKKTGNNSSKKKGKLRNLFKPFFKRAKSKTGSHSKKEESQSIAPSASLAPMDSLVEKSNALNTSLESAGTASTRLSSQPNSPSRQAPFGSPKGPAAGLKAKREALRSDKDMKSQDTYDFDTIMTTGAQTDDWNTIVDKASSNSNNEAPMWNIADDKGLFGESEDKIVADLSTNTSLKVDEAQPLDERTSSGLYSAASGSWGSPNDDWFSPMEEIQKGGMEQVVEASI